VGILANARKEVAAAVASTDWQVYYLPQLKSAIDRALNEFGRKYGVELQDVQRSFWEQGIDRVDLPLREVGIIQAIPEIDMTMLSVLQDFSADLVTGLTQDAIKKINQELTLGLTGGKQPYEVMQAIGRNLKDKSVFKSIAARAETITRTEAGRVLEAAGQARKEHAARVVPGLKKQWYYGHSPKVPRLSHLAAAQAYGPGGDPGPIPVDQPFIVQGEELMYPRDPAGSAGNTINCGCTSIPYHEDWEAATEKQSVAA